MTPFDRCLAEIAERDDVDRCTSLGLNYRALSARWRPRVDVVHTPMTARAACRLLQGGRRILQLCSRFNAVHLAQSQHGVPEREPAPLVCSVAHRPQVERAMSQSLFLPVETAREKVSPQADAALAATVRDPDCHGADRSAARSRQRSRPSSAASSARVTSESLTHSCLSAREASSPRMWRADAEAIRSPVNRTIPFERSDGKPANVAA